MKVVEISPESLRRASDAEVLSLHHRLHQLWETVPAQAEGAEAEDGRVTREDLLNAHAFIEDEFKRRGLHMAEDDKLRDARLSKSDEARALSWIQGRLAEAGDSVLVPAYISLVGSAVADVEKAGDLDVLVRDDLEAIPKGTRESLFLLTRKLLDPGKVGKALHFMGNPQGPHLAQGQTFVPLFDLVLRSRADAERVSKSGDGLKVDLGCGDAKPDGFLGIDKSPGPRVDVVADLEKGIPLPDSCCEVVRARHVLEHLSDPRAIMGEIWRVLRPNGVALLTVPSTRGEGAFAHPDHKSFWNRTSFRFYTEPDLAESIGFPGLFKEESVEEERRSDEKQYVHARMRKVEKALTAGSEFKPPKPTQAYYLDFLSTDELWNAWAEKRIADGAALAVQEKLDGFHAIVRKHGDKVTVKFEGGLDRTAALEDIAAEVRRVPGDLVLDGDMALVRGGKRLRRPDMMVLNSDRVDIPEGYRVVFTAYDAPVLDGEDIHELPYEDRLERLRKFFNAHFGSSDIVELVSPTWKANNRAELDRAVKAAAARPTSEGAMVKDFRSPYPLSGGTGDWVKLKNRVELKVLVLAEHRTADGSHTYRGGLVATKDWPNTVQYRGQKYVDLGNAFNTKIAADPGDVLTARVLELFVDDGGALVWLGAAVEDVDRERKEAYTDESATGLARRAGVWQERDPKAKVEKVSGDEGDETRGERAAGAWQERWQESFPKSGRGKFVVQAHWRGLSEDEAKLSHEELLRTDHSVHNDLRLSYGPALAGWSVFTGKASANRTPHGSRLLDMKAGGDDLQVAPKLPQPLGWLTVGEGKGTVVEPGGPGSTGKTYSKFFVLDHGDYDVGVWKEHAFEVFLGGGTMTGRYIISGVPFRRGERTWVLSKPPEQKPLAEQRDLQDEMRDQAGKGRRWLVWAKPGERPKLLDLREGVSVVGKIIKRRDDEGYVLARVLVPDDPDHQGDVMAKDVIRETAWNFIEDRRLGLMHRFVLPSTSAQLVESWIQHGDGEIDGVKVTDGTWLMGIRILDPDLRQAIREGKITGVSVGGKGLRVPA